MTVKEGSTNRIIVNIGGSQVALSSIENSADEKVNERIEPAPCNQQCNGTDKAENDEEDLRVRYWKEGSFSAGLVDVTWADSRKQRPVGDIACCLMCSSWVCPFLGADRVGNMAVLKRSKDRLDIVVGPYWPLMVFATYPLIIVLTILTGLSIPENHVALTIIWSVLTISVLLALFMVSFRDPGIFLRHAAIPDGENEQDWRWNDQARTFRPRGAKYDTDCAVVVDGFHHTCPWAGTAIGKRNMTAFKAFLALGAICLILDIFLMTHAF